MKAIDRRHLIGGFLCGAVAGVVLAPGAGEAMPFDERVLHDPNDMIEKV